MQVGDELVLIVKETLVEFAKAIILNVTEKKLGDVTEQDYTGHEKFIDKEDMLKHYKEYYGEKVTLDTLVKIISFRLV